MNKSPESRLLRRLRRALRGQKRRRLGAGREVFDPALLRHRRARPFSIYVNTFGTGRLSDRKLEQIITKVFDFTPAGMIKQFSLLDGNVYRKLPRTFSWTNSPGENTDKVKELRQLIKA